MNCPYLRRAEPTHRLGLLTVTLASPKITQKPSAPTARDFVTTAEYEARQNCKTLLRAPLFDAEVWVCVRCVLLREGRKYSFPEVTSNDGPTPITYPQVATHTTVYRP